MKFTTRTHLPWRTGATVLGISALLSLSGCFGGSGGSTGSPAAESDNSPEQEETVARFSEGRVFKVEPGEQATEDMVAAMIQLRPGDALEFGCGYFDLYHGLLVQATEDVEIRGCGKDETVLNFRDSDKDRKSTRLNSSHVRISYAVFCLKKKKNILTKNLITSL